MTNLGVRGVSFEYMFYFLWKQSLNIPLKRVINFKIYLFSILFYPIILEPRGTTDEFATIPFHLVLFSAALVELAKSIPVHSLILSSHLFFCLPLFLFRKTGFYRLQNGQYFRRKCIVDIDMVNNVTSICQSVIICVLSFIRWTIFQKKMHC